MQTSALVDLESLEDSSIPVYLTPSSVYRAYVNEKQRRKDLERVGVKIRDDPNKVIGPKWRVQDPNPNLWREKTFDDRTLYGARDEVLKTPNGYPLLVKPPSPYRYVLQEDDHIEFQREKTYIQQTRAGPCFATDGQRFWGQTIKQYNRPKDGVTEMPYRSPRAFPTKADEQRQAIMEANPKMQQLGPPMDSITKIPTRLKSLPRLMRESSKHYCDVLGPASCSVCIEAANRRIAGEVQRESFPQLDSSVIALVAPRLARTVNQSNRTSRLKRRLTSRSLSNDTRPLKSSILKMSTCNPDKNEGFGRAGIERVWAARARTFYSTQSREHFGFA